MRVSIFSLLANTAIYSVAHRNAAQSASVKFAGFSFDLLNERAILYEPAPHLLHHGVVKFVVYAKTNIGGCLARHHRYRQGWSPFRDALLGSQNREFGTRLDGNFVPGADFLQMSSKPVWGLTTRPVVPKLTVVH